jgi:hypothetical protein
MHSKLKANVFTLAIQLGMSTFPGGNKLKTRFIIAV